MILDNERKRQLMTPSGRLTPLVAPRAIPPPTPSPEALLIALPKLDAPMVQPTGIPHFPWQYVFISLVHLAQRMQTTPAVAATQPDAPSDGQRYARQDGAWVVLPTPPTGP